MSPGTNPRGEMRGASTGLHGQFDTVPGITPRSNFKNVVIRTGNMFLPGSASYGLCDLRQVT